MKTGDKLKLSEFECADCGATINEGEYVTFGVCNNCFQKNYRERMGLPEEKKNTMENMTKEQDDELKQDIEAFTLVKALDLLDDCHYYLKANPPSKETMSYSKWENLVEETDYMREYNANAAYERANPDDNETMKDGDPKTNGIYLVKVMMCDMPYEEAERIDEFKNGYWINYAQFVLSWKPIPDYILQACRQTNIINTSGSVAAPKEDERDALIKAQSDYIDFLSAAIAQPVSFLHTHNWNYSEEDIEKGKKLKQVIEKARKTLNQ